APLPPTASTSRTNSAIQNTMFSCPEVESVSGLAGVVLPFAVVLEGVAAPPAGGVAVLPAGGVAVLPAGGVPVVTGACIGWGPPAERGGLVKGKLTKTSA